MIVIHFDQDKLVYTGLSSVCQYYEDDIAVSNILSNKIKAMENQPKMESSKYEADLNFQSKFLQRSMHCSKFYRIEILISENSTKHQDMR